jgi:hypothetical protein
VACELEPALASARGRQSAVGSAGHQDPWGWRADRSRSAAELRLAVLVAEATISRSLAEDGYLSARQLSVDLRPAAAWLGSGAEFGP